MYITVGSYASLAKLQHYYVHYVSSNFSFYLLVIPSVLHVITIVQQHYS